MNINGLLVGAATFLLIGCFHVVVVKTEYYFTKNVWPVFALVGAGFLVLSLFLSDFAASSVAAVFGITCLWSIKELFEQEKRVEKGWFPRNPRRKS